jgi:hypothetical protein
LGVFGDGELGLVWKMIMRTSLFGGDDFFMLRLKQGA